MMRCCLSPWHSPDPILSPHHLRCQYTPCLHNCNSLIWNFCLDNIRACVSRAGDCIAIDSSHWGARCGYQLSVSDRSLGLISFTILITTHNTNQTHVEFCPTNPTPMNCVFFLYKIFKHGILLCWPYSHPSENMTNAENHSVNFPLVAFNDPYDQYYIISQTRGGLLRLHNWVFMQNKLYSQSQHYVPWWNVTPLTFKWLERLTDKMLLPLTGDGEGEM